MRVAEIMEAEPVTVYPHTPVEEVLRLMGDRDLPGLPVVSETGRCVGIITETDLVMVGEDADLHLPHYVQLFGGLIFLESLSHFEDRLRKASAARARDLMTDEPTTIDPDAEVREAARVIADSGHNRLPVVDRDGRLVGVVTRADVLRALTRE
jgi:CBS domain-containing protein